MSERRESGSFLERWAKRKREAARGDERPTAPPAAAVVQTGPDALDPAELEARLATLPPLDDIDRDTDIRPFLEKWVPAALRNAALRRVWSSDPRIVDFKEVADYQWDWNVPGGAPGCGPLEPDFDTEAAVRRIFREVAPSEEARRDGLSQEPDQSRIQAPASVAVQHEHGVDTASSGDPPSVESAVQRRIAGVDAASSLDAAQQSEGPPEPAAVARRRRHGGALPSSAS
jgi:hypothetical protein